MCHLVHQPNYLSTVVLPASLLAILSFGLVDCCWFACCARVSIWCCFKKSIVERRIEPASHVYAIIEHLVANSYWHSLLSILRWLVRPVMMSLDDWPCGSVQTIEQSSLISMLN